MKKQIKIGISTERQMNLEFIRAFRDASKRRPVRTKIRLYFLDAATLVKTLSNQRLNLLQVLHELGEVTIKKLSVILKRDYKNVYDDVQLLMNAGLIDQNNENLIFVPWDKIQTEINLVA